MSIFGTMFSGLSAPLLATFQGDDVTRWAEGVEANAVPVADAIWVPQAFEKESAVNPQITVGGTLAVPADTEVADGDLWVIGGERFKVQLNAGVDPATGRRDLELVRAERTAVRNVGGQITLRKGFQ